MKKYDHNYNEGDILFDIEHKEVFAFKNEIDGFVAEAYPHRFRIATKEEAINYMINK